MKIVKEYSFLNKKAKGSRDINKDRWDGINNLRNSLFHCTPLNMYLVYGKGSGFTKNQMDRRDIVKFIESQKRDVGISSLIDQTIKNTNKFIEIKNSQQ